MIETIISSVPPTVAATAALIMALKMRREVNGRLSELVEAVRREADAEGELRGRADERRKQ